MTLAVNAPRVGDTALGLGPFGATAMTVAEMPIATARFGAPAARAQDPDARDWRANASGLELAIANRTFTTAVLVACSLAVLPAFAWMLVKSAEGGLPADAGFYLKAAGDLQSGVDPYTYRLGVHGIDETRSGGYVYPPLLAWTLQPVAHLPVSAIPTLLTLANLALLTAGVALAVSVLRVTGWRARLGAVLLVAGYYPVAQNFVLGQANLLVLLLCTAWLWSFSRGTGPTSGLWLGLATSVKLLQAPILIAEVVRRRHGSVLVAALTVGAAVVIAGPQLGWEFVSRVFPGMSSITGVPANLAPAGTIDRLLHPSTVHFYGQVVDTFVRGLALGIAAMVAGTTAWRAYHGRSDALAVGCLALATWPLVSTLDWAAHLAALVPVILYLVVEGVRRHDRRLVAAGACAWLLTGPVEAMIGTQAVDPSWYLNPQLRPLLELPPAGLWVLWAGMLVAVRMDAVVRPGVNGFNFAEHAALDPRHWWVKGRAAIVTEALRPYLAPGAHVLDVGCGGGLLSRELGRTYDLDCVDVAPAAVMLACSRGVRARVVDARERFVPGFDAAVAFDVLEHVADDHELAERLAAAVRPGGVVAVAVPAFRFLWSPMDTAIGHRRRYRLPEVVALMAAAGVAVDHATYFNCLLFPVIAAMRLAGIGDGGTDVALPGAPANWMLTRLFECERRFVARHRAPFGVSLLLIGHVPGPGERCAARETERQCSAAHLLA